MAEGLLKGLVREDLDHWQIASAGLWAMSQAPAAENTLKVLEMHGVDLSDHVSKLITEDMVEEFNLILTMERNHKEALRVAFPEHVDKIFTLREIIGKPGDVADPIGYPFKMFEETAREIEGILLEGFSLIKRLAEGGIYD